MAVGYDQLYILRNNHTKFRQKLFSGFRGVASTKCFYVVVCIKSIKSNNSCKTCRINMVVGYDQLHMISRRTIIQNFSECLSVVSKKLRPQKRDGRTHAISKSWGGGQYTAHTSSIWNAFCHNFVFVRPLLTMKQNCVRHYLAIINQT